jgi:hypothetical protein
MREICTSVRWSVDQLLPLSSSDLLPFRQRVSPRPALFLGQLPQHHAVRFAARRIVLPETCRRIVEEGPEGPRLRCGYTAYNFRGERGGLAGSLFLLAFQRAQRCADNLAPRSISAGRNQAFDNAVKVQR